MKAPTKNTSGQQPQTSLMQTKSLPNSMPGTQTSPVPTISCWTTMLVWPAADKPNGKRNLSSPLTLLLGSQHPPFSILPYSQPSSAALLQTSKNKIIKYKFRSSSSHSQILIVVYICWLAHRIVMTVPRLQDSVYFLFSFFSSFSLFFFFFFAPRLRRWPTVEGWASHDRRPSP